SHIVEYPYPAIAHQNRLPERPAAFLRRLFEQRQERRHLADDGCRGQPVADYHLHVGAARTSAADLFAAAVAQAASQVGAQQVFRLPCGAGVYLEQPPALDELAREITVQDDFCVDRVEGGGVVLSQGELGRRAVSRPGTADEDAGGSALPEDA